MEYTTEELDAVVRGLKTSREQAIKRLFDILYDPLLYFANQYLKNLEHAEEIVADSFIKLWERREDFNNFLQIRSFMYICTKNASLNLLRNQKNIPHHYDINGLEVLVQKDSNLLDKIIKTELLNQMYIKLQELPEKQRNVFRLTYLEDLSAEEISNRLEISLKSVYTNRSRALYQLKRKMSLDCILLFCLVEATRCL